VLANVILQQRGNELSAAQAKADADALENQAKGSE
jgi:hypothetical protein